MTSKMVTVPDNEETTDLKPDPQAVKAAATREQISPTSQHEKSFRTRSKSLSSSSVRPRQTLTVNTAAQEFIPSLPNDDTTEAVKVRSWEMTLELSIKAIVAIKANDVRSFDTEVSGEYTATGFVVDAERGLILSNRHVVSPGPAVAQAVFTNYEEVELEPIYRDPVHDFGFFRFNPKKVKFIQLVQIPLSPERAKVGVDIRVVGNDAGEKLSILAGTLARLDRRAPEYGIGEYNDFNTFYLQAASGTSGGSSGSPVLDIDGHAIALNAGGASRAQSSYYLPLDRIVRALGYLQKGQEVPRGTLQTEFEHSPYDELRRLGLKTGIEQQVREKFPEETGLLVVRKVLPKGPADGLLIPGDILIKVNGNMVTNFNSLFSIIDDSVGEEIILTIGRGKVLESVTLRIQDLHSITPNRFVEIGGGVVNELSYQLAHSYQQPVGGPYVATPGHMLASASAWRKSVIVSVNNIPTPNLDAFIEAMKTLPDGARVPIRFYSLLKFYKERVMIMHVDRHWHKFQVAVRDDNSGKWIFEEMLPPPAIHSYIPATASYQVLDSSIYPAGKLWPSFVALDFHLPYLVSGMKSTQFRGSGVVLSTDPPLIACDRDTIPISVGDIFITFANSIIIPGRLLYLHPFYNYAILTYDASLLGETPVVAAELNDIELNQGDEVYLVGIGNDQSPVMKKTIVTSIRNVGTKECSPPRWRAMNVEGIGIDDPVGSQVIGGVLCTKDGRIQALWLGYSSQNDKGKDISFMFGLSISLVRNVLEPLRKNIIPKLHNLNVEFWTMRIAPARTLGLTDKWVRKIEGVPNSKHTLLYVLNILDTASPAGKLLKVGDVVLKMNGRVVTRMADLPTVIHNSETVDMLILRDGKEMNIQVATTLYTGEETTRVIGWAGALIEEPYHAVLEQVRYVPSRVYISCTLYGSPAAVSLKPGVWIVEIAGRKVTDLGSFLEAIHNHEKEVAENEDDDGYVRIKTVSRMEVTKVVAMKLDPHYWGTWQLVKDENATTGWKCIPA